MTTFCRLDELGLVVVGQHLQPDRAVLACRVADDAVEEADRWCRRCGCEGRPRDTVTRRLARLAEALAVSWSTANTAVLAEGQRVLLDDPTRFDGVKVIGVDEHVWRHTRRGDKFVTVVIDLTPVRDKTGPSRLLAMVEGRSKQAFTTWLASRPRPWRDGLEVVAMDGFTGFKTATTEQLPTATAVMDPFHVVRLAGDALDRCRRRVQQDRHGHRGRKDDPLYRARRTLHTGADLLTDRQRHRLTALFGVEDHVQVEATWGVYQRMIGAYRHSDRAQGRQAMSNLTTSLSAGVPAVLTELRTLGRTLKKRAQDVLAYFDRPGTSNGPTEAVNGCLEHLRGSALGFRNLTNYIARSLLETGGFRPRLHPQLGRAGLGRGQKAVQPPGHHRVPRRHHSGQPQRHAVRGLRGDHHRGRGHLHRRMGRARTCAGPVGHAIPMTAGPAQHWKEWRKVRDDCRQSTRAVLATTGGRRNMTEPGASRETIPAGRQPLFSYEHLIPIARFLIEERGHMPMQRPERCGFVQRNGFRSILTRRITEDDWAAIKERFVLPDTINYGDGVIQDSLHWMEIEGVERILTEDGVVSAEEWEARQLRGGTK